MRTDEEQREFVEVIRDLHRSTGKGWEDLCVLFGSRLRIGDRELIRKVVLNDEYAKLPALRSRTGSEAKG